MSRGVGGGGWGRGAARGWGSENGERDKSVGVGGGGLHAPQQEEDSRQNHLEPFDRLSRVFRDKTANHCFFSFSPLPRVPA